MLRRARIKLAPNVGAASRQQKPQTSESVSVIEPSPRAETHVADEISVSVPIPDGDISRNNSTPLANAKPLSCPPPPSVVTLPPPAVECGPSTDKENFLESSTKDKSIESPTKEPTLVAVDEHSSAGSSSLSRFKARNKARPVIRESSHRVRTFSSASESEEDGGRRKTRTPLSPVKKVTTTKKDVVEQIVHGDETEHKSKTKKKKNGEKTKLELKKEAMKKKFASGKVDRKNMTMFDLIYNNPINPDEPARPREKIQMRLKPYEVEALSKEHRESGTESSTGNFLLDEKLAEEDQMRRDEEKRDAGSNSADEDHDHEGDNLMPAPQVRVGPDGEIILDDRSLVIDTTQTKKDRNQLANAPIVIENSSTAVNYGSWRKRRRSARWSKHETARFHLALRMLGTNFSLMERLFPKRTRIELKRKFKSEEKCNRELIDKATSNQIPFDLTQFEDDSEAESEEEKTPKERKSKGNPKSKTGRSRKKKKPSEENPAEVPEAGDVPTTAKTTKKRGRKAAERPPTEGNVSESPGSKEPPKKKSRTKKSAIPTADGTSETQVDVSVNQAEGLGQNERTDEEETESRASKSKNSKQPSVKRKRKKVQDSTEATDSQPESDLPKNSGAPTSNTAGAPTSARECTNAAATSLLTSLLQSPLGQLGLEQGGITVVESSSEKQAPPSFLVPPTLAEANPVFAQAQPGSLVLVSTPNPSDPQNQLVHVYRVTSTEEPVST